MKRNKYSLNIIFSLIVFFVISFICIYSAKEIGSISTNNIILKQIIFYILGIIVLISCYFFKDIIIKHSFMIYIILNLLLLFLLFFGVSINGSKCWIFIGPFSLQPSEFMKIFLIIVLSKIISKYDYGKKKKDMKSEFFLLLKLFIITLIPSILTFLEPDTGVVIIYFIILISLIITKGINKKWYFYFAILLLIIISSIIIIYLVNKDTLINVLGSNIFYRIERIFNWSNQSGYQLKNSLISIGSSGIIGFGINNLPLYFPEASTDFVFTTFATTFGFIGSISLILIIIIFDITLLNLCNRKIRKSDKYIIIGITCMIFYQQIQNISMTLGLLPITGITLPFISYGGSSLLSYMIVLGFIFNIIKNDLVYLN